MVEPLNNEGSGGGRTESGTDSRRDFSPKPPDVQPVRADFLRERWGTLPDAALQRILLAIAWSVGLVHDPH